MSDDEHRNATESGQPGTEDGDSATDDPPDDEESNLHVTDPSDALTDPAEHVPAAEAPDVGVDVPEPPEPEDVPEGLRAEFWELVFAFNVSLFTLALGAMLVVFQGKPMLGGFSLTIGVLAGGYGICRYRNREHTP